MPVKAGPKDETRDNLVFGYNMADLKQSFDGYPVQNFVLSSYPLYRYNNPGFSGYNKNTGRVHPLTGTPIWELAFYPQDSGRVPRLASTEGFGCYHSMGTALESGKIYLASIMVKEGPGTQIFNNYINHGYSNIGGWNSNGTTNTREYVGDGWWRFYTLWNNQTTAYSEDGVTPLATRYMSNYYTTFDLPAGESIVESVAMNFAAYVGNTPYRGTYNIVSSVQDDYNSVGVTILDWGIDSSMTKPEYTPVFNYPDPNFSRTVFYRINMGAAGRCRIRTYTYGVSISLTDSKYWKMTFRNTAENKRELIWVTAPMIHEVPSLNHKKPWVYVDGTRTGGLRDLATGTVFNLSTVSKSLLASGFDFDGTNDYITVPHDPNHSFTGDFSIEAVIYPTGNTANCIIQKGSGNDYYQEYWLLQDMRGSNRYISLIMGKIGNGSANYINTGAISVLNQYHHIIATVSGTTATIYVNGVQQATGTISDRIQSSSDIRIGWRVDGFAATSGNIPLVKLYNRAITQEDALSKFNSVKSQYNIG